MRMSTTFIIIAVISLFLGALTILPITQSSLDWSIERLTGSQKENMRQVLADSFRDKKLYLSNLSNVIQSDANLAGALVLADASQDYSMLNELLSELRNKSNLEYFEVMPIHSVESKVDVVGACLKEFEPKMEGAALCQNAGNVMIAWTSPVFLYGEKVGIMFLGANLVSSQHLRLVGEPAKASGEVYRLGKSAVVAELNPNIESIQVVTSTLRKVIILGAIIALVFMLIFIGLAVRYFFLMPFHSILSDLDRAFLHIEQKKSFKFVSNKTLAWENRRLVFALESFVSRIMNYENQLSDNNLRLMQIEKSAAIGRLSRQVAHDIRSPLTALQLAIKQVDQLQKSHRELLVSAVERIDNIANELLKNYNMSSKITNSEATKESMTLIDCLNICVQEKILIAKQKNIDLRLIGKENEGSCLIPIDRTQFQNIVSNIISNAIEASSSGSHITIQYSLHSNNAHVIIQDQGSGIPDDVLSRIGNEEITFGKVSGNGLGLFSAKQMISECGGRFNIRSKLGVGTEVQITLPVRDCVSVSVTTIHLIRGVEVIVIDDDKTIHEVWRNRLSELTTSQTVLTSNFLTVDLFSDWYEKSGKDTNRKYHFFVDYDFHNQEFNGLDIISQYGLAGRAVLVTAHFSESDIIARAKALGVPIIPKPLLASIPIVME